MSRKSLLRSLCFALAVATAFGQTASTLSRGPEQTALREVKKLEQQAGRLDREAKHAMGNHRVFESLSRQLGVPADVLKAQRRKTRFSFGQLFIASALANETGKTFDQIAREFKSGRGWGEIAQENNVKLGKIVSEMRRSTAEMRNAHKEEMRGRSESRSTPEASGRPENSDRPEPEAQSRSAASERSHRRGQ